MTTLAVPVTKNQGFDIEDGRQNINNKRLREVWLVENKKRLEV